MNDFREDTAMFCPQCSFSLSKANEVGSRRTCPNCGSAMKEEVTVPWTAVARVSNLAEAGFLADELVGQGIKARLHQLDDFNALHDRWTSVYLLQVPTADAERAAMQIQLYRDDDI